MTSYNPNDPYAPMPRTNPNRKEPFYYIVRGRGKFPQEMLLNDMSWAITGIEGGQTERAVVLATWQPMSPSAQWSSFGWVVQERRIPKPNFLS